MLLEVRLLHDPVVITAILTDPWVSPRLRHDAREPGYVEHPALTYYGAYANGALAGVFLAIRHTPEDVEVHAALLRYATRYGRDLGRLFLAKMWCDPTLLHVTAPILATLPSAVNYTRQLGFELEGVRRQCCRVNGAPTDVIYMGLLRPPEG